MRIYETKISKEIQTVTAWLEDPTEQLPLLDMDTPEPQQTNSETVKMQKTLTHYKENLAQVQRAKNAISSTTKAPFVWDIAFVEIFNQRGGF